MRKPIATQEAERIVCNGGTVWRGKLAYSVICGRVEQRSGHFSHALDWWQFHNMDGFEVEIPDNAPSPNDSKPDTPTGANGPGDPQWMTPGQALEWMASHIGEWLEDDAHGARWRIPSPHGSIVVRESGNNVSNASLPFIYSRRFRVPVDKQAPLLPKLPDGYSFRDVGDAGYLHLFAGDNDIGCVYSRECRDAYAALVQLWDQEHASK